MVWLQSCDAGHEYEAIVVVLAWGPHPPPGRDLYPLWIRVLVVERTGVRSVPGAELAQHVLHVGLGRAFGDLASMLRG
jgi:hypothetical protein